MIKLKSACLILLLFLALFSSFHGCRSAPLPTEVGPPTPTPTATTGVLLVSSFGSHGTDIGMFKGCSQLAFDQKNKRLLVADSNNFRIQFFDAEGNYLNHFIVGSYVYSLCINDSTSRTYVTRGFYQKNVLSYNSSYVNDYGYAGSGFSGASFDTVEGLAVDQTSGNLYIGQRYSNKIIVTNSICGYIREFDIYYDDSCLGICVDQKTREIYVVNYNGTVRKYDNTGNYIKSGSTYIKGLDYGESEQIAVDSNRNRIYVAFSKGYLGILTTELVLLSCLKISNILSGVCVNESTGEVYVSDFDESKISKYQIIN